MSVTAIGTERARLPLSLALSLHRFPEPPSTLGPSSRPQGSQRGLKSSCQANGSCTTQGKSPWTSELPCPHQERNDRYHLPFVNTVGTLSAYNCCHPRTPTEFHPSSGQKWPLPIPSLWMPLTERSILSSLHLGRDPVSTGPQRSPAPAYPWLLFLVPPRITHLQAAFPPKLTRVSIGTEQGGMGRVLPHGRELHLKVAGSG